MKRSFFFLRAEKLTTQDESNLNIPAFAGERLTVPEAKFIKSFNYTI